MSLKFIPATEFLASPIAERRWVVEDVCYAGGSIMLYGRAKIGKTTLVAQLCHSLATGDPWLGFPIRTTGPVLYLQLDMNPAEMTDVLERAKASGFTVADSLFVPAFEENQFRIPFNILDSAQKEELRIACAAIKPVAVIVDTINDSYAAEANVGDVNRMIRHVLGEFREVLGDAVLVFLNHERKGSKDFTGKKVDDEDGYLGGSAWAGVASAILQLDKNEKGEYRLRLRGGRNSSGERGELLKLVRDPRGFFVHPLDIKQALRQWPDFLPAAEQPAAAAMRTKSEVFRAIADRVGAKPEAVKMECYRQEKEGKAPAWVQRLGKESESKESNTGADAATSISIDVTSPLLHALSGEGGAT